MMHKRTTDLKTRLLCIIVLVLSSVLFYTQTFSRRQKDKSAYPVNSVQSREARYTKEERGLDDDYPDDTDSEADDDQWAIDDQTDIPEKTKTNHDIRNSIARENKERTNIVRQSFVTSPALRYGLQSITNANDKSGNPEDPPETEVLKKAIPHGDIKMAERSSMPKENEGRTNFIRHLFLGNKARRKGLQSLANINDKSTNSQDPTQTEVLRNTIQNDDSKTANEGNKGASFSLQPHESTVNIDRSELRLVPKDEADNSWIPNEIFPPENSLGKSTIPDINKILEMLREHQSGQSSNFPMEGNIDHTVNLPTVDNRHSGRNRNYFETLNGVNDFSTRGPLKPKAVLDNTNEPSYDVPRIGRLHHEPDTSEENRLESSMTHFLPQFNRSASYATDQRTNESIPISSVNQIHDLYNEMVIPEMVNDVKNISSFDIPDNPETLQLSMHSIRKIDQQNVATDDYKVRAPHGLITNNNTNLTKIGKHVEKKNDISSEVLSKSNVLIDHGMIYYPNQIEHQNLLSPEHLEQSSRIEDEPIMPLQSRELHNSRYNVIGEPSFEEVHHILPYGMSDTMVHSSDNSAYSFDRTEHNANPSPQFKFRKQVPAKQALHESRYNWPPRHKIRVDGNGNDEIQNRIYVAEPDDHGFEAQFNMPLIETYPDMVNTHESVMNLPVNSMETSLLKHLQVKSKGGNTSKLKKFLHNVPSSKIASDQPGAHRSQYGTFEDRNDQFKNKESPPYSNRELDGLMFQFPTHKPDATHSRVNKKIAYSYGVDKLSHNNAPEYSNIAYENGYLNDGSDTPIRLRYHFPAVGRKTPSVKDRNIKEMLDAKRFQWPVSDQRSDRITKGQLESQTSHENTYSNREPFMSNKQIFNHEIKRLQSDIDRAILFKPGDISTSYREHDINHDLAQPNANNVLFDPQRVDDISKPYRKPVVSTIYNFNHEVDQPNSVKNPEKSVPIHRISRRSLNPRTLSEKHMTLDSEHGSKNPKNVKLFERQLFESKTKVREIPPELIYRSEEYGNDTGNAQAKVKIPEEIEQIQTRHNTKMVQFVEIPFSKSIFHMPRPKLLYLLLANQDSIPVPFKPKLNFQYLQLIK